jgi:hypothetical protein
MSENPLTSVPSAEIDDLKRQIASLRDVTQKLQYGLIAFTWIIGMFLFIQVWRSYKDVRTFRPQIIQIVEMARREDAAIAQFVTNLGEHARTHPDVRPLLTKYGIPIPTAPTSAPAAAPKPATAPAPKK